MAALCLLALACPTNCPTQPNTVRSGAVGQCFESNFHKYFICLTLTFLLTANVASGFPKLLGTQHFY